MSATGGGATTAGPGFPPAAMWRGVRPYMGGDAWLLAGVCVCAAVTGFAEAALLVLIVKAATTLAAGHHTTSSSAGPLHLTNVTVGHLFVAAALDLVLLLLLSAASAWLVAHMATSAIARARRMTFEAFVGAPWSLQAQEPDGRLQEALGSHTWRLGQGMMQLSSGVVASINFLTLIVSAMLVDFVTAIVMLSGAAVVVGCLVPLMRLTRRLSRANMAATSDFAFHVTEAVSLAREIKTFNVGPQVAARGDILVQTSERSGFRVRTLQRLVPSLYQYLALGFLVLGLVVVDVLHSAGNIANLGAVVLLLVRGLTYAQQVSTAIQQSNETAPYIANVDGLRRRYIAAAQPSGSRLLPKVETVALDDVTFGYEPSHPVLHRVSFEIERGEAIGIVGPSGSGKSTLVQLLLGLRSPDSGAYLVNGLPASDYDPNDWARRVVLVPQDNRLLHGTVLDNIRFFREEFDDDDLVAAAKMAHVHDDIMAWPDGYQSVVGSGASDVSGGQRQRIGLARALAGSPGVLVLDEPTSALDMHSERLIQNTLHSLSGELTMFIVAHRISTLNLCDRILVLDQGEVAAFGTHAELAKTNKFFAEAQRLSHLPA